MEGEIVCLDTSILIDYFRKKNKENSFFYKLIELGYSFSVTSITTFQIYRGIIAQQRSFWDDLFRRIEVLSFDEEASKMAATLLQKLNSRNNPLALSDLFIAAIAIQNKQRLVTLNKKHFGENCRAEFTSLF